MAASGEDATLINAAQDLLHEGKLEEAGKIYNQLLSRDESNVDRAAENHFNRAQIYTLQFRPLWVWSEASRSAFPSAKET